MYNATFERFSSAYDHIDVMVEPSADDQARISRPFIEDIWYWMDGVTPSEDMNRVYLRTADSNGHVTADLSFDVDLETLRAPEHVLRQLGIREAPSQELLWLARPGHSEQLERFYV